MYITKGDMIKALEQKGIRRGPGGKKLSHCKIYEIINLYCEHCK